jgi:hypothetical protein
VILGLFPGLIAPPIALASAAVTRTPSTISFALWHGVTLTLGLSALTLAGSVILFAYRRQGWRLAWPQALQTEHLYSQTLSALDSVSRRIGPLLQGASLRSYVLVVALTAIGLVTTALAMDRALPIARRSTSVQFHEGVLATLVVAGALSAAFCAIDHGSRLIAGCCRVRCRRDVRAFGRTGPRSSLDSACLHFRSYLAHRVHESAGSDDIDTIGPDFIKASSGKPDRA